MKRTTYTTDDEKNFITHLADSNQHAFWNYSEIVLNGLRRYDDGVDVGAVRLHMKRMTEYVRHEQRVAEVGVSPWVVM